MIVADLSTGKNHKKIFKVSAAWNYFESSHGKDSWDGISGTAKPMDGNAVNQKKCLMQDAFDFYAWAKEKQTYNKINMILSLLITLLFVLHLWNEESCTILGIMKLHVVIKNGGISYRYQSCYCENCFQEGWLTLTLTSFFKANSITKRHKCVSKSQKIYLASRMWWELLYCTRKTSSYMLLKLKKLIKMIMTCIYRSWYHIFHLIP